MQVRLAPNAGGSFILCDAGFLLHAAAPRPRVHVTEPSIHDEINIKIFSECLVEIWILIWIFPQQQPNEVSEKQCP